MTDEEFIDSLTPGEESGIGEDIDAMYERLNDVQLNQRIIQKSQ